MSAAASRGADLVLVDTAGRLHTKVNLMEELEEAPAHRRPHARARSRRCCSCSTRPPVRTVSRRPAQFADAVDVTGVVLTKLDGTAKGGIVLAIEPELGVPVKLVGIGEAADDLVAFDPEEFVAALVDADAAPYLAPMFDSLSDRFDGIFTRCAAAGSSPRRTSTRSPARSGSRCSRPTSTSTVVKQLHRARQGAGERRRGHEEPEPRAAGHQDRARGAGRDARRHDRQAHDISSKPPTVVMLAGLQGSGKTTASAKLAQLLKSQGRRRAARRRRPATAGRGRAAARARRAHRRAGVLRADATRSRSRARALEEAARLGRNVVIVDTAGRLQIDAELMDELRQVRDAVNPNDTLLVVDAMTGQEAVNVADRRSTRRSASTA